MQPDLCRESERFCQWLMEMAPVRMSLDAREYHTRRTKYTINRITRITIRT